MSTEQEYDTLQNHDADADGDGEDPSADHMQGQYPPQFEQQRQQRQPQQVATSNGFYQQQPVQAHPQMMPQQQMPVATSSGAHVDGQFEMIDPGDPMLDADPFGLSASMHYPTAYQFGEPQRR